MCISVEHRLALKTLHRFLRAQDWLAQWMVFPEILREDFVHQVVGIIFIHLDFFNDDATLTGNVAAVEYRVQNQVAENVQSGRDVFVQDLYVEANAFLSGEGIHVAADGVDLAGDFLRRAVLGPLENHVLDEV